MVKNYVLDTNVLIHDPDCINKFEDNVIYIPHPVIEELDDLKKNRGETGYNARKAIRSLKALAQTGNLLEGVPTAGGGTLKAYVPDWFDLAELPNGWDKRKMDNLILLTVKMIQKDLEEQDMLLAASTEEGPVSPKTDRRTDVILVSNDANVQLKAPLMGIEVQDYQNDRIKGEHLYTGRSQRMMDDKYIETYKEKNKLDAAFLYQDEQQDALIKNEYVILKSWGGASFLTQYDGQYLRALYGERVSSWLQSRNSGQRFLEHSLMTPCEERPLTICCGPAGTGKTLYALACGLEQVMDMKKYQSVLLCRANVMMDEEIGFLPGTEKEKISPLMRGAYDNISQIFAGQDDNQEQGGTEQIIEELMERGFLEMQSLAYLRGRSIANTFIIIDEAQNCTPSQMLSIITRAGENTKIVLLGDPDQIDNDRLDRMNNGLVFAKEKMKGSSLCDIISFVDTECVRSALAKEASDRMRQ